MVVLYEHFIFPGGPQNITDITDFTDITNITNITGGPVQPARKIDLPTYFSPPKSVRLAQGWKGPSSTRAGGKLKFFRLFLALFWQKSGAGLTSPPCYLQATRERRGADTLLFLKHSQTVDTASPRRSVPCWSGRFMHSGGRLMKGIQVCRWRAGRYGEKERDPAPQRCSVRPL